MLIGKFEAPNGEEFWATGEDVEIIIKELRYNTCESVNAEDVVWFRAVPVRVVATITYTVDE